LEVRIQARKRAEKNAGGSTYKLDLKSVFKSFDINKDGSVDKSEFKIAMESLGVDLPADEFEAVFNRFDKDHDNTADYKEFVDTFYNRRQQTSLRTGHQISSFEDIELDKKLSRMSGPEREKAFSEMTVPDRNNALSSQRNITIKAMKKYQTKKKRIPDVPRHAYVETSIKLLMEFNNELRAKWTDEKYANEVAKVTALTTDEEELAAALTALEERRPTTKWRVFMKQIAIDLAEALEVKPRAVQILCLSEEEDNEEEDHIIVKFKVLGSNKADVWPLEPLMESYISHLNHVEIDNRIFYPGKVTAHADVSYVPVCTYGSVLDAGAPTSPTSPGSKADKSGKNKAVTVGKARKEGQEGLEKAGSLSNIGAGAFNIENIKVSSRITEEAQRITEHDRMLNKFRHKAASAMEARGLHTFPHWKSHELTEAPTVSSPAAEKELKKISAMAEGPEKEAAKKIFESNENRRKSYHKLNLVGTPTPPGVKAHLLKPGDIDRFTKKALAKAAYDPEQALIAAAKTATRVAPANPHHLTSPFGYGFNDYRGPEGYEPNPNPNPNPNWRS